MEEQSILIDDIPHKLGRPNFTVLALVNKYIWCFDSQEEAGEL
jgi:hypothetical protein